MVSFTCSFRGFVRAYAYVQRGQKGYAINGTTLAMTKRGSSVHRRARLRLGQDTVESIALLSLLNIRALSAKLMRWQVTRLCPSGTEGLLLCYQWYHLASFMQTKEYYDVCVKTGGWSNAIPTATSPLDPAP